MRPKTGKSTRLSAGDRRLREAMQVLGALHLGHRQQNEVAGYTLLALLDLRPSQTWSEAAAPLRGITPIIEFIAQEYGVRYAPNTRETVRDEAVKYFVEYGILLRNSDYPSRPTNSGKTVYQVEPEALSLFRAFGSRRWLSVLRHYLDRHSHIRRELELARSLARIPVKLPGGKTVALSPGGQNPLIKTVVEQLCPRFVPGGTIVYIGDAESKFRHLETD